MTVKRRTRRVSVFAIALAGLLCSACANQVWVRFDVEPQDATIYVNGRRLDKGHGDAYPISFDGHKRAWIQAAAPDRIPERKVFDKEELLRLREDESGNRVVSMDLQRER